MRLRLLQLVAPVALLAACSADPSPEPTPAPTTFPLAPADQAAAVADAYLKAWEEGDFAAMHAALAPAVQERYPLEQFSELHASFSQMTMAETMTAPEGRWLCR